MTEFNRQDEKTLNDMAKDVGYIRRDVDKIIDRLENDYVTEDRFQALKDKISLLEKIIYGLVGMIIVGFMTAVISFFIKPSL